MAVLFALKNFLILQKYKVIIACYLALQKQNQLLLFTNYMK